MTTVPKLWLSNRRGHVSLRIHGTGILTYIYHKHQAKINTSMSHVFLYDSSSVFEDPAIDSTSRYLDVGRTSTT